MGYDLAGRKTSMNEPNKGAWQYRYNSLGELTRQRDGKSQSLDFTFDALGRTLERCERTGVANLDDGSFVTQHCEVSTYNTSGAGIGQLNSTRYQTNTASVLQRRSWHYDALGRAERVTTEIGASQWSEETTFDQYGRVFQHFDASGDDNGLRYHYRNGHVEQLQEARDGTSGVVYQKVLATDAYGNVTAAELDDGAIETFASYEQDSGRLLKLTAYRNSVEIQEVDYLFDALGNLQHRHDRTGGTNTRERFTYDTLNRLKTAQLSFNGGGTWQGNHLSVSYAANGNITSKSGVGSYGYGAGGAGPHAVTSAGGITYLYDANGNNTSSSDGRVIEYTVFDKAWKITKGSSQTRFDYGIGQGRFRRSDEQWVNGSWSLDRTTTYLGSVEYIEDHAGGESYFLRQIAGVALQRYYVNSGVRQTDFLVKDHLGSIHTVVQDNGTLERMHFGAFGERVSDVDWTSTLGSAVSLDSTLDLSHTEGDARRREIRPTS